MYVISLLPQKFCCTALLAALFGNIRQGQGAGLPDSAAVLGVKFTVQTVVDI